MKFTYCILLLVFFGVFTINAQQQNTLQNQGNVGIGTTSPTKSLEVVGESEIHGKLSIDSTLLVKDTALFERNVSFSENFEVSGEGIIREDLRIDGHLEVGGATVLENGLNVYENINFFDLESLQNLEEEELLIVTSTGELKKINILSFMPKMYSASFNLNCGTNGHKPMWSNDYGKIYTAQPFGENCEANVGIGTSEPIAKLHLMSTEIDQDNKVFLIEQRNSALDSRPIFQVTNDGITSAREVIVDQEEWPDYVFDENYELMTLKELKQFILENGHLPNVPAVKDIEAIGLSLGDTAKITMEQVE